MKTEFLVIVSNDDNFCSDETSLINFIQTDSFLYIKNTKIKKILLKKPEDTNPLITAHLTIHSSNISLNKQKYFLITIENDTQHKNSIELFSQLSDKVKDILISSKKITLSILWDDVGRYYAEKAYPIINETENLMRKLITMFLTINVGINWIEDSISSDLLKTTERNSENKNPYLNMLYDLDFIHLSNVLFSPKHDILNKLDSFLNKKEITNDDIQELKNIRKSNWDKYFASKIDILGEALRKKWKKLYELRCAVAHNRYIDDKDFKTIDGICSEINGVINRALDRLHEISITEMEKEDIKQEYRKNKIENNVFRENSNNNIINRINKITTLGLPNYKLIKFAEQFKPHNYFINNTTNNFANSGIFKIVEQFNTRNYFANDIVNNLANSGIFKAIEQVRLFGYPPYTSHYHVKSIEKIKDISNLEKDSANLKEENHK